MGSDRVSAGAVGQLSYWSVLVAAAILMAIPAVGGAQAPGRSKPNVRRVAPPPRPVPGPAVTPNPAGLKPDGAGHRPGPAAMPGAQGQNNPSEWDEVKDAKKLELGIEYKKPRRGARFSFNLVDADLMELVKIIGNITGKAFIIGGTVPQIKATIYAPTQISAREAYRTFLSVLQVNGLTVIPSGRYLKIVPVKGATGQTTPITRNVPNQDQIVTRLHRLEYVSADDLAGLLERFKSADGDIAVYGPTNTLIITDYGSSIRRLVRLISLLDVEGGNEQIYVEPINYASADELASRIQEIFEISAKGGTAKRPAARGKKGKAPAATSGVAGASSLNYSKVLADERTNSLIIVASEEGYLRILELIKVLDVPVSGEGTLHVRKLQHASAEDLAKTLNTLTRSNRGDHGAKGGASNSMFEGELQISADKATNSLVIVSSQRDYASLNSVINQLDVLQRQVFVEAVIMEVSLDKQRDVGIGVHGGKLIGGQDKSLLYGISASQKVSSLGIDPTSLTGLAAGVTGPAIPDSAEIIGLSVPAFGIALRALQTNNDVNVLSTPNILASDNAEATISVGENVPVLQGVNSSAALLGAMAGGTNSSTTNGISSLLGSSGALSGFNSYSRQDVGISLTITPHINDDNQVRLEVDLEISEVKSIADSGPTISKQNAKTTSVIADQQTFVLGGLITDNQVETTTKVPVLGDIPLIGMLFRTKKLLTKKRNLLIFLTPYIIRNADDFREIFQRKMAERREFIERYTAFEYHRYEPHLDWSRTKGAITVINEVMNQAKQDARLRVEAKAVNADDHSPKRAINLSQTIREGDQIVEPDDASGEEGEGATETTQTVPNEAPASSEGIGE